MHWFLYIVLVLVGLGLVLFVLAMVQGISARRSAVARGVLPSDRPEGVDYQHELFMLGDSVFSGVAMEYWSESVSFRLGKRLGRDGRDVSCVAKPRWSSGELHEAVAKMFVANPDAAPRRAVVCIGLNDVFRLIPAQRTVANIMQVCALLQAKRRDVELIVVELAPIYELPILSWPLSTLLRWKIRRVNRLLYANVKQAGFTYLCVPPMDDALVAADGLHPSARAHGIMAETFARAFLAQSD